MLVFDIKRYAINDGPGIRTTIFMKGCPLRCVWCHNPEGLSPEPQLMFRKAACRHCGLCRRPCGHPECRPFGRCLHICPEGALSVTGEEITPAALAARLRRSLPMADGVTFSGGEPLLQADFLQAVLDELEGVPCALETCGWAPRETFLAAARRMELVYLDIKLADPALHERYTGVSNAPILANLAVLREGGIPAVIRTPLIPGITDTRENLDAIRALIGDLPWEQLPYNALAGAKYEMLGMEYPYDWLFASSGEKS